MKKSVTKKFPNFPGNPDEFISWLNEKIKETGVPRKEITLDLESESDYGDGYYPVFELSFMREETEKEKVAREEAALRQENWERRQLKKLKEKYGD